MKLSIKLFCAGMALSLSTTAWAYYDVLDTGEIMNKGAYKLTSDAQLLTSEGGGNAGAIFDAGFDNQFGARVSAGFGKTDYFMGGLFKWMPVPDVENQPAIGFNVGLLYAKWEDSRDLTIRFEPLVSKKFTLENVVLTPYASLPFGIRTRNSDTQATGTDGTWQFVAGSQVQVDKWKNLQFIGEIGLDLAHSFSHISGGAVWYFDEEKGFELK